MVIGALLLALGSRASPVRAEDRQEAVTVQKTKDGLHFNLPPDWPIEKRGGVLAPIPIEEYLARKFNAIDSRLQLLEQRLNGLDVRLRVLEEEAKTTRQRLRSVEPAAPSAGGKTPEGGTP